MAFGMFFPIAFIQEEVRKSCLTENTEEWIKNLKDVIVLNWYNDILTLDNGLKPDVDVENTSTPQS